MELEPGTLEPRALQTAPSYPQGTWVRLEEQAAARLQVIHSVGMKASCPDWAKLSSSERV